MVELIQNTATGQSHPWLWTLLKGELPCRSTQLQAVTKLNRFVINISSFYRQSEENIPSFGRAEMAKQGRLPRASQ